jgi:hypothetical protein
MQEENACEAKFFSIREPDFRTTHEHALQSAFLRSC